MARGGGADGAFGFENAGLLDGEKMRKNKAAMCLSNSVKRAILFFREN